MHSILVIVCAGDNSYHHKNNWFNNPKKNYNLWVCYYGDTPQIAKLYENNSDLFIQQKGPKWQLIRNIINQQRELVNKYKYLWLPDDDLQIDSRQITRFFEIMLENSHIDIMQPSLRNLNVTHKSLIQKRNSFLRKNYVEIQAPLLKLDVFFKIYPVIDTDGCKCGWGLDDFWTIKFNTFVSDAIIMTHTKPLDGAFYKKFDINPYAEKAINLELCSKLII